MAVRLRWPPDGALGLSRLPDGWCVIPGLRLGPWGQGADRLVIGPPGVYACLALPASGVVVVHARRLSSDGRPGDGYRLATESVARVRERLDRALGRTVEVWPVLVVSGAELRVARQPVNLTVVHRRDLRQWLQGRPVGLSADEARATAGLVEPVARSLPRAP